MIVSASDIRCDVVVIGGSTAALFAALHSAREGAVTCLVEPTDWMGGQLTAGGVPAVDFAWRTDVQGVNTKKAHKLRENNNYEFFDWLQSIGNPGGCTVSRHCFLPNDLLNSVITNAVEQEPDLFVLKNTVPIETKVCERFGKRRITELRLLKRHAKLDGAFAGYERPFSEAVSDWYSRENSEYFTKQELTIRARKNENLLVVEASEFGDVLALSSAPYLVGEDPHEGAIDRDFSASGQSFTFTFNLVIREPGAANMSHPLGNDNFDPDHTFDLGTYGWEGVWTYRRLRGANGPDFGQVSVMNWKQGKANNGNDYASKYLFLSYERAQEDVDSGNWAGGVCQHALQEAEHLSSEFGAWFISKAPEKFRGSIAVDNASVSTAHGFYKFPYLRESRRSVGYNGFLLCAWDLSFYPGPTGYPFADRIGTSVYDYDIHASDGCRLKNEVADTFWAEHPKPFFIPLRALSNAGIANLIVAGKCMAQSFRANAATRLHPGEAVSGTAAGVVAAYCSLQDENLHDIIHKGDCQDIQSRVSRYQPLHWKIGPEYHPRSESDPEHAPLINGIIWSDSLQAYFDHDCLYFDSRNSRLATILASNESLIEATQIEEVESEGHRLYKVDKLAGFNYLKIFRSLEFT